MRRLGWAALLLGGLLLVTLLRLPAAAVAELAEAACRGHCRLSTAQGLWWQGQAQLHLRDARTGRWHPVGPLSWRLSPGAASWLRVDLAQGRATLRGKPWDWSWQLEGLAVSAALLPALGLPPAALQGTLHLLEAQVQGRTWQSWQGQGRLEWRGAASGLLAQQPLGDLRLDWRASASQGLQAQLSGGLPQQIELSAQLRSDVSPHGATLAVQGQLQLSGQALGLERYARLVGEPQEVRGHYRIDWSSGS